MNLIFPISSVILILFGLMLWISGDFANAISVNGLGRVFGGALAMILGVLLFLISGGNK